MLIENAFTVDVDPEFLWHYLLDVEKIAPCMPGAELTEVVDDRNWKGKLNAKFGPVSLSFAGTVTMQERDDVAHKVTLSAKGMESKGKGAATAKVTSWLEPPVDGCRQHDEYLVGLDRPDRVEPDGAKPGRQTIGHGIGAARQLEP